MLITKYNNSNVGDVCFIVGLMASVRKRHSVSFFLLLVAVLNFVGNNGLRIVREEEIKKENSTIKKENKTDDEYEPTLKIEESTKINKAQAEIETPSSAETNANLSLSEIIEMVNRGKTSWKAGFNKDVSKYLRGGSFDKKFAKNISQVSTRETGILKDIPKTFDARTKWPKCPSIGMVYDQGNCGACWAISAASVMSDRLCISSGGKENFVFSVQELISCCESCRTTDNGCDGGFAYKAFKYWIKHGLVSGGRHNSVTKGNFKGCKPYSDLAHHNATHKKCERKCSNPKYDVSYQKDKRHGREVYTVEGRNVKRIQSEIIQYGPVVAQMEVYEDFAGYQNGVYKHKIGGDTGVKHGIKIIGWGVEDGEPYWLVANSWGLYWGKMDGFFKILRGEDHCGIEDTIIGAALKDSSRVQNLNFYFLLFTIFVFKF